MSLYSSGRYAVLNPGWHEEDAPEKARVLADTIRLLGSRPRSVLDVGCGTGAVLDEVVRRLAEAGVDVRGEGWDLAPDAIRRAQDRVADGRLAFRCGDVLAAGPEVRADLVLCVDTFEHVGDDVAFLDALRSRGDGFLFRIPLDLSALDVLRPARMIEARRRFGHRHGYTRALAFEVLGEAGYDVVAWRHHRVAPELGGIRGRAVDLARRALFAVAEERAVDLVGGWSLIVAARPRG